MRHGDKNEPELPEYLALCKLVTRFNDAGELREIFEFCRDRTNPELHQMARQFRADLEEENHEVNGEGGRSAFARPS